LDLSITRVAVTQPEDAEAIEGDEGDAGGKTTEMGRKALVPYGLYRGYGFVNPHFGKQTGFTVEDLSIFWQALQYMWDLDRSASRGLMACRGLYVFSHATAIGNASAHTLFERIAVRCQEDVEAPRKFSDYQVAVDEADLLGEVSLTRLVG
jgi:CRISPR-associated protein Csd2